MTSAGQSFGWTAQLFSSSSTLDVLVIVLYFVLVLGIALWVSGAWSGGRGGMHTRPIPDPHLPVTWSPPRLPLVPAPAQPFAGNSPSLCSLLPTERKDKSKPSFSTHPPK